MNTPLKPYTKKIIVQSFNLEVEQPTEEDLISILADRVAFLLANQLAFFFSKMYSLDIDETKVIAALSNRKEKPAITIAKLIIERQIEKQVSREKYKME